MRRRAATAVPAPPPPLMPGCVGLDGTRQVARGRKPTLRSLLCSCGEGSAVGELVMDLQPVLKEDPTTQAEGASVDLRKVPAVPTRQIETERGSSHFTKSRVAAIGQLFPPAQLTKGA